MVLNLCYNEGGGIRRLCENPEYREEHNMNRQFKMELFPHFDKTKREDILHCCALKATIAANLEELGVTRAKLDIFGSTMKPINAKRFQRLMKNFIDIKLKLSITRLRLKMEEVIEEEEEWLETVENNGAGAVVEK